MSGLPQHSVRGCPSLAYGRISTATLTCAYLTLSLTQPQFSCDTCPFPLITHLLNCLFGLFGIVKDFGSAIGAYVFGSRALAVNVSFAYRSVSAEFDGYGNADILRYGKGANAVFNTCAPLSAGNNQSVAAAFGTGYTGFGERFYGNGYAYSCGLIPHRGTGNVFVDDVYKQILL